MLCSQNDDCDDDCDDDDDDDDDDEGEAVERKSSPLLFPTITRAGVRTTITTATIKSRIVFCPDLLKP